MVEIYQFPRYDAKVRQAASTRDLFSCAKETEGSNTIRKRGKKKNQENEIKIKKIILS